MVIGDILYLSYSFDLDSKTRFDSESFSAKGKPSDSYAKVASNEHVKVKKQVELFHSFMLIVY